MEIQVKEIDKCVMDVHYIADADQIDTKKNEVLTIFKDAPVPGFRKGKADLPSIRLYYAKQINEALKRALAEEAFHNTLFEQEVKPFGAPDFKSMSFIGKKFECDFTMRVFPKFELGQYKDIEIPKQHVDFNVDHEVEKTIENLRHRFGESVPFTDEEFVQPGDTVILDYEAFEGSTKIDQASGSGQIVTIGNSLLPGFDDNLLGMKNGEVREFSLKIPETGIPEFAGKEIKFVVTLTIGSKTTPVPLTDELAIKAGKKDMAELREYVTGAVKADQQERERSANVQQVMSHLIDNHSIDVPSWLLLSEAQFVAASGGSKWEDLSETQKEQFLKIGGSNIKSALILDKVRENEPEAQLSDAEVMNSIEQNLLKTHAKEEVDTMMVELAKTGRLNILATRMRDEFTIDFILKNTKFVE